MMPPTVPRARVRARGPHLTAANLVVVAWLAAAVAAVGLRGRLPNGGWLALHLLLLGAVTNAIVAYGEYFARSLLRAPGHPVAVGLARLAVLNGATAAVLAGVAFGRPALAGAGALALAAVVAAHAAWLGAAASRPFGAALAGTVWYYVAAAGALLAGIGLGALLTAGGVQVADVAMRVRLAHAHANLLGWIGLTVLGTQLTLVPTVLRARLHPGAARAARVALPLLVLGLVAMVAALLAGWQRAAGAGAAVYAAGALVALGPTWLVLRDRRTAARGAAWTIAAALAWLAAGALSDAAVLVLAPTLADAAAGLARLLPALAAAVAAQVVIGALSYLLPMLWGRGAHGNRRLTALLEIAWPWRLAAVNAGAVLTLAGPVAGWLPSAGWALVAVSAGSFVLLATLAMAMAVTLRSGSSETRPAKPGG